jgi:hypothetical protein
MKKALTRIENIYYGDLTGIRGNLTDLTGDLTGITGNLSDCCITDEERKKGIDISELIL